MEASKAAWEAWVGAWAAWAARAPGWAAARAAWEAAKARVNPVHIHAQSKDDRKQSGHATE